MTPLWASTRSDWVLRGCANAPTSSIAASLASTSTPPYSPRASLLHARVVGSESWIGSSRRLPKSGDQGVDLLLNIEKRRVAVQLKRYIAPVGNAAVQAVFAGMIHYKAQEAWVITTSSFTKSAVDLAKSTGVRLIDRTELEDWLSDLREEV